MMKIKELLALSIKQNASDLHISAGSPPILRIHGDLMLVPDFASLDATMAQDLIYSAMDKQQQQAFEKLLELDFAIAVPNLGAFRVNVFHQRRGIAAVFRVIPDMIPTLEQIGAPSVFKDFLNLSSGLILVTGPTGCGKSTTMAAMINYINTHHARHIITIEDPIEFTYQNNRSLINQRQVHRDTMDFSGALRSALREDPDVILVGEMRDLETIRLVLTAAETGHLVLATLHTSSAPRAVSRIMDVFPAGEKNNIRNLVAESLQAVICQTLVKKISSGRAAVFEVMLSTPAIKNLIREDKIAQLHSVIQTSNAKGMFTMEQSFKELIARNVINPNAIQESYINLNYT